MKKFIISLICCIIIFGGFYVFKNKNALYNKFKNFNKKEVVEEPEPKIEEPVKVQEPTSSVDTSLFKDLSETLQQLTDLNKKMDSTINQRNDSITTLHLTIDSLNQVLASKPKIKIQSSPYTATNQTNPVNTPKNNSTPKNNKNEKNLPIARGNDAVQLKEFFTDRYDHRR